MHYRLSTTLEVIRSPVPGYTTRRPPCSVEAASSEGRNPKTHYKWHLRRDLSSQTDRYQPLLILIGLKFPRLEQEGLAVKHVR